MSTLISAGRAIARAALAAALIGTLTPSSALAQQDHVAPSPLLAIDRNRSTVIERIVGDWGVALEQSNSGITSTQLRAMLEGLRADHLLAASLVGSLTGLRDVLGTVIAANQPGKPALMATKALGDAADDLVYTPVSPCRLFDTRASQGGSGTPALNVRRTYGAITPVTSQGGPGGCVAAASAAVALIQIGTLTPSGSGLLQGGPQGVASFPNALILYQAGDQYGTAVAMPLNAANGRFDLVEQFATADLYGDLLGYFARPANYGGTHVISGLDATDGGGYANTVSGDYSVVAGGSGNKATGLISTVGGGDGNTASGIFSTVGGGESDTASGFSATVAGGFLNIASGDYSTVGGGQLNTASGQSSYAAGHRAKATTNGTFMWADSQEFDFVPSVGNFFGVRATGGAGITVAINPITGAPTQYCNLLPGVPSWQCTSDRNAKENFVTADGRDVLRRLVAMPLYSWNFKGADPSLRSLGPTAQDFREAFGLGNDDKTIATVNIEGVALAAIQGLHQIVQEKDAKIDALVLELAGLRRAVDMLLARTAPEGKLASTR